MGGVLRSAPALRVSGKARHVRGGLLLRKERDGKEVRSMSKQDDAVVISEYSLQQAIADGVLVEIFKNRWGQLSGGKPIVATEHIFGEVSLAGLMEIWNEFVDWRNNVKDTLPEEEQMFTTTMNGEKVWLIEDGQAFTLLYPEDY
jgi:hypothetical protein